MAKIKEIKCSETSVVYKSCDKVFNVSSVEQLKHDMIDHYLNREPHSKESQSNFNSSLIGNVDAGIGELAKKLFEDDRYGKVIKNN